MVGVAIPNRWLLVGTTLSQHRRRMYRRVARPGRVHLGDVLVDLGRARPLR